MMRLLSGHRPRLPAQDCLELADAAIPYRIRESTRRRTLALELRADGALTVAAPAGVPLALVRRFVASRRRWIETQRALLAQAQRPRLAFESGARLPLLGGTLTLQCLAGPQSAMRCRRAGDTLAVQAADGDAARRAVEAWYRRAAVGHFAERVAHFAPQVGRAPHALAVRAQRTRWGSCRRRRKYSTTSWCTSCVTCWCPIIRGDSGPRWRGSSPISAHAAWPCVPPTPGWPGNGRWRLSGRHHPARAGCIPFQYRVLLC